MNMILQTIERQIGPIKITRTSDSVFNYSPQARKEIEESLKELKGANVSDKPIVRPTVDQVCKLAGVVMLEKNDHENPLMIDANRLPTIGDVVMAKTKIEIGKWSWESSVQVSCRPANITLDNITYERPGV